MTNKVYVVVWHGYDDYYVDSVWLSKRKAEEHAHKTNLEITEHSGEEFYLNLNTVHEAKIMDTKLDQIKRRKSAEAPGTYPGQNRSRKFTDRKKKKNKERCRGKKKDD